MSYRETDIEHENGPFWVLRTKRGYSVMKAGVTHSVSDSTYNLSVDGLSLAKARADYLAKRSEVTL